MVRPKNEIVWKCFTKKNDGSHCNYCKKKYVFANVSKMTNHILACFKCPEEIKKDIRTQRAGAAFNPQSKSGSDTRSHSSETDAESDQSASSSKSIAFATPSTSTSVQKQTKLLGSFVDHMTADENVSSYSN